MKVKWLNLLGRMGSILLAIGLAFALIAMIPPQSYGGGMSGGPIMSGRYRMNELGVFSQWQALRVSIESDVSLKVVLFDLNGTELQELFESWVREYFPNLPEDEIHLSSHNNSVLESVVQENSEHVLFERVMATGESAEIYPTQIVSITAAVANYSPDKVYTYLKSQELNIFVPQSHIIIPAEAFILCGGVLAFPLILRRIGKE